MSTALLAFAANCALYSEHVHVDPLRTVHAVQFRVALQASQHASALPTFDSTRIGVAVYSTPGAKTHGVYGVGGVGAGGTSPVHAADVGKDHSYWQVTGSDAENVEGPIALSHVNCTWMPRFVPSGHASPFCTVSCTPLVIGSHCGGVTTGVHSEIMAQPKPPDCVASAAATCR